MNEARETLKKILGDKPIAYHPILAKMLKSATAALFLSQCFYWDSTLSESRDGWFWKTQAEMQDETGLTRSEQDSARRLLKESGYLSEIRKGIPARMWYKVEWETFYNALAAFKIDEKPQSSLQNPANKIDEKPQTITESTTETTQENTDIAPAAPPANFTAGGNSYVNGAKLPASIKGGVEKKVKPIKRAKLSDHIGVQKYFEVRGVMPKRESYPLIATALGEHPTTADLDFWSNVIRHYVACGWNPTNVAGMIDWYKRRELPHAGKGNGHAQPPEPPPDEGPATLEDVKRNNPALYERIMARQKESGNEGV